MKKHIYNETIHTDNRGHLFDHLCDECRQINAEMDVYDESWLDEEEMDEYSEYIFNEETGERMILPKSMFWEADMNPDEDINVTVEAGKITIMPASVLGRIPQDLLELYDELGISREVVECVIAAEAAKAGGYDALLERIKSGVGF